MKFLYGLDTYSLQREVDGLKAKAKADNIQLEELDFDAGLSQSELLMKLREEIEGQGLFSQKKILFLWDFVDEMGKYEKIAEFLTGRIKEESKDTQIVFAEHGKPDGRKKFFKDLKKTVDTTEFSIPTGADLVRWAEQYVADNDREIDPAAAKLFCRLMTSEDENEVLHDLWQVRGELDKMLLFAENDKISEKVVNLVVSQNSSENVFLLTNAMASGDSLKATRLLEQIVGSGSSADVKGRVIKLMGALVSQVHSILLIKSASGSDPDSIAKELGWKKGRVWITLKLAKKFSLKKLEQMLTDLKAIDRRVKSSDESPKLLLTLFLQKK